MPTIIWRRKRKYYLQLLAEFNSTDYQLKNTHELEEAILFDRRLPKVANE